MELITLLPPIYNDNLTMNELQSILSENINTLAGDVDETIDECFIQTASVLLSRYEKIYGLSVDVTKSNSFRRERIAAKVRGVGTVTKQLIKDTAKAYSNGEVEVIEDAANNHFVVRFTGSVGIPANVADLILTIEEIKPTHLSFNFEYTYRRWSEVSKYLWGNVAGKTWYQLATE